MFIVVLSDMMRAWVHQNEILEIAILFVTQTREDEVFFLLDLDPLLKSKMTLM
jgi:hypothetical protein